MIAFLKRLFACPAPAADLDDSEELDRVIRERKRADREYAAALARDRYRVAQAVSAWAHQTMYDRRRAPLPPNMPRSIPITAWLPGLTVLEISNLKAASVFDIEHHIYHADRISRVRPVQALEESVLVWPPRVPPPTEVVLYGGKGGPRRGFGALR